MTPNLQGSKKYRAGILGATGLVGQQLLQLLAAHPWFEVSELAASSTSAGKRYAEATRGQLSEPILAQFTDRVIKEGRPGLDCDFVFSCLEATIAGPVEEAFAQAGYPVVSNSRSHRMEEDVPLVVPEVNADHVALLERQKGGRGYAGGFLLANPNCSAVGLVLALKPLQEEFGLEQVSVVSLQAVSGAGRPGLPGVDIVDNVLPFIPGEEDKLETEPRKILGRLEDGRVRPVPFAISTQCNRVPVLHGHMGNVSVKLKRKASVQEVENTFRSFRGEAQRLQLPTALDRPLLVHDQEDRPQPRLDRDAAGGMAVSIGRIRPCPILDIRFTFLVHNLLRGAAGAALLNAERWLGRVI